MLGRLSSSSSYAKQFVKHVDVYILYRSNPWYGSGPHGTWLRWLGYEILMKDGGTTFFRIPLSTGNISDGSSIPLLVMMERACDYRRGS
jgi:hypothetical protein